MHLETYSWTINVYVVLCCFFSRLILYGVVCTMQDKHETAETFFESATSFQPQSILAWTMLGRHGVISAKCFKNILKTTKEGRKMS